MQNHMQSHLHWKLVARRVFALQTTQRFVEVFGAQIAGRWADDGISLHWGVVDSFTSLVDVYQINANDSKHTRAKIIESQCRQCGEYSDHVVGKLARFGLGRFSFRHSVMATTLLFDQNHTKTLCEVSFGTKVAIHSVWKIQVTYLPHE